MNRYFSISALAIFASLVFGISASSLFASDSTHVSARTPVTGVSRDLSAERSAEAGQPTILRTPPAKHNKWKKQAVISGAVIHDISFPTLRTGYAAAELGQVWKTKDGGAHWTEIMNLGFPYYWFGVHALTSKDVVISGFNDNNFSGIIRWSHDGGKTWTDDIVLTSTGWSYRVRFAKPKDALVLDGVNTQSPNSAHYTTDGGAEASDWTSVVPDPNGGWFGNQFSLLSNLHARIAGITYCDSKNVGATWACHASVDSVFDGPVFFTTDKVGWVGGGEISPNVEGWVHRTANGGKTWSGRTLDGPWPIREIRFINAKTGWAAGGNIYSNVGGMYFSSDGGKTWSVDINTGAEMDACDSRPSGSNVQVWCAGYDSALNGQIYTVKIAAAQ